MLATAETIVARRNVSTRIVLINLQKDLLFISIETSYSHVLSIAKESYGLVAVSSVRTR